MRSSLLLGGFGFEISIMGILTMVLIKRPQLEQETILPRHNISRFRLTVTGEATSLNEGYLLI